MRFKVLLLAATSLSLSFISCEKDDGMDMKEETKKQDFVLTIENVQTAYDYQSTGVFNTPIGSTEPGGAGPGGAYEFTVFAGEDSKLSFATMFVGSNDLFFGTDDEGLSLYNNGKLVTGDVTSQIKLWDAGTEVNEMPGSGANQPMNQSGPNTGADENGTVINIDNVTDGFTYPSVENTIKVTITEGSEANQAIVKIENLSGSTTPIAPGVWVIHNAGNPIFKEGMSDSGYGLESLAEDGSPSEIFDYLDAKSGINTPFAPGVWAVHSADSKPIFDNGMMGTEELELLAEDGDPSKMATLLSSNSVVSSSGVFNTPMGSSSPAPIFPGQKYEFSFTAEEGESLSIATMYVQSNDLFYGVEQNGYELWSNMSPKSGDLSNSIKLWDAGTEENEYPGFGANQPVRQSAGNTGKDENMNVMEVNDGFMYLMNNESIKVTLTLK